jgi:hypothetical protein
MLWILNDYIFQILINKKSKVKFNSKNVFIYQNIFLYADSDDDDLLALSCLYYLLLLKSFLS